VDTLHALMKLLLQY